jgi:hypothetical protein
MKRLSIFILHCLFITFLLLILSSGIEINKDNDPADLFLFYSTLPETEVNDGEEHSFFTEAFLKNIGKNEPLNLLAVDIASDTYMLSSKKQRPVYESRIMNNKYYSVADPVFEKRYALLVGINNYNNMPNLKTPANDVQEIAEVLLSLGYEVDVKIDIDQSEMIKAFNDFREKLSSEKQSEGFFWFAGMGVEINSANYMFLADSSVASEDSVKNSSFPLGILTESLVSARNKINVVCVDSCRNNPLFLPAR